MKITIYTITDCPFSKQEKEYLSAHGLVFAEKNLETNREFLTEMLAVGSNFAGTPVTKIEKDDGQIAVLKGFTPAEFDKTLGFAQATAGEPTKPTELASQTQPVMPQVEEVPSASTSAAPVAASVASAPQPEIPQTPAPAVSDPAMASVLDNLVQQAQQVPPEPISPSPATPPPPAPVAGAPVIPDPQF
ncbi:MAG: glutaredoxin family protein [bacterium]